jgi:hypothetical protein
MIDIDLDDLRDLGWPEAADEIERLRRELAEEQLGPTMAQNLRAEVERLMAQNTETAALFDTLADSMLYNDRFDIPEAARACRAMATKLR